MNDSERIPTMDEVCATAERFFLRQAEAFRQAGRLAKALKMERLAARWRAGIGKYKD